MDRDTAVMCFKEAEYIFTHTQSYMLKMAAKNIAVAMEGYVGQIGASPAKEWRE